MNFLRLAAATVLLTLGLSSCTTNESADPAPAAHPTVSGRPLDLTLDGLKTGTAPKIGWASGTKFKDNADVLPANVDQFAQTKQLLVIRDVDGNVFAYASDGPAGTTPIGEATGDLVINDNRNLVAWIAPDGSPTVLQEGEVRPAVLEKADGVTAGDAVAVLGHDCFNGPETVEGAGCSVYFRASATERPQSYVASNHGFVEPLAGGKGGISLQDADETGEVGWTTLNRDQSTCSTLTGRETLDADTAKGWTTCDHMPLTFSPDGKHLLATGPHGFEGLGASSLSILDRSTGEPTLTVQNNARSQAAILDLQWEDDTHVLGVVVQGRKAAIVRVGLDGSMEVAGQPVDLPDVDDVSNVPFRLSVQP